MFSSSVTVTDYVMEDYMVLANYVLAFEGKTVAASNSPLLEKYSEFGIDCGTVNGFGRIMNAQASHEPVTTEETVETFPEETAVMETEAKGSAAQVQSAPFPVLPLVIAILSLGLLLCLAIIVRKTRSGKE